MLYILLIIIAVGVLLISEPGQVILGWIIKALLLGVFISILLWAGFFLFEILSNKDLRDNVLSIAGLIMIVGYFSYLMFDIAKKIKTKEMTIKTIKKTFTKEILLFWSIFIESKMIRVLFYIIAIFLFTIFLILILILITNT